MKRKRRSRGKRGDKRAQMLAKGANIVDGSIPHLVRCEDSFVQSMQQLAVVARI
jgi:hypothetical protein